MWIVEPIRNHCLLTNHNCAVILVSISIIISKSELLAILTPQL